MKLKNIWKNAARGRFFGGPIGALAGAVLAGIGWEVGSSIYRAVAGKKPVENQQQE